MMAKKDSKGDEFFNVGEYKQTIQLQDLIMLTDMYSIPQLLTLLAESELTKKEIEYQVQAQIPHSADVNYMRKLQKKTEVSVVIPYNGATIGFVISILASFGLSQLKFETSCEKVRVVKVKLDGFNMSENELLSIVHKIELIFHMAQFSEEYSAFKPSDDYMLVDSQNGGVSSDSCLHAHDIEQNFFSQRENILLGIMMTRHNKYRKRLAIKKKAYEKMEILEIQNYLSRDYHYFKWHLVEVCELQEREIASYGFKKQFSDIINFMRSQSIDKSMELEAKDSKLTVQDINSALNQMQIQRV